MRAEEESKKTCSFHMVLLSIQKLGVESKVFCDSECLINFSQTKFVAIILLLLVFLNAIFRLTDFSSDPFDFLSLKTR